MELKSYQRRVIEELSSYLDKLTESFGEYHRIANKLTDEDLKLFGGYDFAQRAWLKYSDRKYHSVNNDLGKPVPDLYIKVPTGGGKTLLALHAIHAIQHNYLCRSNGLVLWIVPSEQIYTQTVKKLKDKGHHYRQLLDNLFSGRILIREKEQQFGPHDCQGKLVIMPLMLPATNRNNKESLRLHRSSGMYSEFFPDDDDHSAKQKLNQKIKNLKSIDDLSNESQFLHSLANVFRMQEPVVIVDEGHKAYSNLARKTLSSFNPSFILELSATPHEDVNILGEVTGRELYDEDMIKLDINLVDQAAPNWKTVLDLTVSRREELERLANVHLQNTGRYIRPIALVQVDRTGKGLFDSKLVHSDDVVSYLSKQKLIDPSEIAVKSSSRNDLAGWELLSPDCPIKYIITKQALQEGWDCAFAYVLAILSNLTSNRAVTQLVGRVLRQPHATKTGITELDECYVHTNHGSSDKVVGLIKQELAREGLEDLGGCVNSRSLSHPRKKTHGPSHIQPRKKFKKYFGSLYLPQFVLIEDGQPRPLQYDNDLVAKVDWNMLTNKVKAYKIQSTSSLNVTLRKIGYNLPDLNNNHKNFPEINVVTNEQPDPLVLTKRLADLIPNVWVAHKFATDLMSAIFKRERRRGEMEGATPTQRVLANYHSIIDDTRKQIIAIRDELIKSMFIHMLEEEKIKLMLFTGKGSWKIPAKIKSEMSLFHEDGSSMTKTLLEVEPSEGINGLEKSVAIYLDKHEKLLWWYRNLANVGFYVQGWKKHRVYPDFLASKKPNKVLVAEIKGSMLQGNEDTRYKRSLLELCDRLCRLTHKPRLEPWSKLAESFPAQEFYFQIVDEDDWKGTLSTFLDNN